MQPIDWVLDNNTITGKLVAPAGNPIAHKRIGIKTEVAGYCQGNSAGISYLDGRGGIEWFWSGPWLHESWTDADGEFHLRGLAADLPIHLYTNHGDLKEMQLELEPLQHGEHRQGVVFLAELGG